MGQSGDCRLQSVPVASSRVQAVLKELSIFELVKRKVQGQNTIRQICKLHKQCHDDFNFAWRSPSCLKTQPRDCSPDPLFQAAAETLASGGCQKYRDTTPPLVNRNVSQQYDTSTTNPGSHHPHSHTPSRPHACLQTRPPFTCSGHWPDANKNLRRIPSSPLPRLLFSCRSTFSSAPPLGS